MFQIIIPKRSSECTRSGEKFEPGQKYYSTVRELDDGSYEREDYNEASWEAGAKAEVVARKAVHWRGVVPAKKKQPRFAGLSRDDRALVILKELLAVEEPDQNTQEQAFVLGLYLSRQRVLLTRKQIEREGQVYQLYEISGAEEIVAVPYLTLPELEVSRIQEEVARKLKG